MSKPRNGRTSACMIADEMPAKYTPPHDPARPLAPMGASTPDESQRARLRVHSELAEALTPLLMEYGRERVAFAMNGAIARWVKEEAEERKAVQRAGVAKP